MKILFNSMSCGLGNNGGSSTIIKSANTLKQLGHDVIIIDTSKNQHTWNKLEAEHRIIRNRESVPNADVVIATGYGTVASTVSLPIRCGIKIHWIRGLELWKMNMNKIIKNVFNAKTHKVVNSICLHEKLKEFGINSHIIRPGYDFDEYQPKRKKDSDYIVLGGLNPHKKHFEIKRTEWIFEAYRILKKSHNIKLYMFGSSNPTTTIIDHYIKQPNPYSKNSFYNSVDIWLSPSCLEGLHMPPAEAMLTECPVVGTNAEMSGTQDYLIHEKTGLVADTNFQSFVNNIERMIIDKEKRKQYGVNARKQVLSLGSREDNMIKFIKHLKGIQNDLLKKT